MFRQKKCSQLEVRLSRARQNMSRTEDENQKIRGKIDELRRLIMMQKEVYETCQTRMRKIQVEQSEDLLHSDNVLYEKDILARKTDEIAEKNVMEVEDTERLLLELTNFIEKEAKASKEFYERQMKETPVFDDRFKDTMVQEIRQRALTYADEKRTEAEIEDDLARIKDAFARLRDEAIGDQSFEDAVRQYLSVESDCIKIMSYIRAKEVEVDVEDEMAAKFKRDIEVRAAENDILRKKMEEVEVLRKERDRVAEEEDRLKRQHGKLKQQMGRWAGALNSVFKALSVDLESMGIYGGRVTADCDLVMLMGTVEAKSQKTLAAFNKVVASGKLKGSRGGSSANSLASLLERGGDGGPQQLAGASPPQSPGGNALPALAPAQSPGGLSLPRIPGKAFGQGSPDDKARDFGLLASDEEDYDSEDDDDDDGAFVKPMSSVDLKKSFQTSLSIGSVASMKGGGFGL